MAKNIRLFVLTVFMATLYAACEKAVIDDEQSPASPADSTLTEKPSVTKNNLTLNVTYVGRQPLADVAADDVPLCTHMCFAVYAQNGTRVKQVNSKLGDADFGEAAMALPEGSYHMVVLAHSCTKNPAMTDYRTIQFNSTTGYTDTYLYYAPIERTGSPQSLDIVLEHVSATCRFVVADTMPADVTDMRFEYKGGGSYINAEKGFATTRATQVATFSVTPGETESTFDLYTVLCGEEDEIQLRASALDEWGDEVYSRDINVPMRRNQRTWLVGSFFTDTENKDLWLVRPFNADPNWDAETFIAY